VITWQQLGFHAKPIGLLNIEGFFDPLLAFFSHAVEQVRHGGTEPMMLPQIIVV
jgi:predicted Rossmann-fold nucleotide-binding protein